MAEETKTCKYCQTEIPKKAKICPNCKKKQGPKVGLIIVIVIVVLIIIGAIGGNSNSSSSSTSTTTTTEKSNVNEAKDTTSNEETAPIEYTSVSVIDLEDAIQENALKASDTYKDQYLEISGCLNVIDASGKYISINAGSDDYTFVNIQCYIKNDEQKAIIMDMSKGNKIVVKGKCKDVGELLGYSLDIDEVIAQ